MLPTTGHYLCIVHSTQRPCVRRHCTRCGTPQLFACSDRFRLNANGRRLDAWLIYRCGACGERWNCEIFERRAPEAVPPSLLGGMQSNDPDLVDRYVRDVGLLRQRGVEVVAAKAIKVHSQALETQSADGTLRLAVQLPAGTELRLDRLLALALGISRSELGRLAKRGQILEPAKADRALRRPVRDGQVLRLDLRGQDQRGQDQRGGQGG